MAPLKPGTKLPPQKQRRNERERRRVNTMNHMYDRLRERISHGANKKMSKVDTVKEATRYIRYLQDLLQQTDFQEVLPHPYASICRFGTASPPMMYGVPKIEPIHYSPAGSPCPSTGGFATMPPPMASSMAGPFAGYPPFHPGYSPPSFPWKIEPETEPGYALCSPSNTSTSSSNTSFSPQQMNQSMGRFTASSCQYSSGETHRNPH